MLARFSVNNSKLVNLLAFLAFGMGIFSMFNLRKEAFPQVDYDYVTITTAYPGAPAEDVEQFVTLPIEKEIKGISGIKEITSKSEEGMSQIGIEIEPTATDKKQVIDDIERAVDRVNNLPEGVKEDPEVIEIKSKEIPVLEISLAGNITELEKRNFAEQLEDQILDIEGVAKVQRLGWLDPEFHVEVNPVRMQDLHVSMNELITSLEHRNITLPGGHLTTDSEQFNVRTEAEFKTPEQVEDVVIRANDAGNLIKVKDVAQVKHGFEERSTIARTNGKRSLGMVVIKNETADIIKVVDKSRKVVENFQKTLPSEVEVMLANDFSYYVKRRLGVLQSNGMFGFFLVVLVLFLFLDPIPAFMTAVGIPSALCMTFFILYCMGISINLVSMLGLIIVLGMLVDDGIVVSENVYRYIEKGMSVREAAVKGASEVIAPVMGSVLTTMVAFAPLLFIPDIIGKFIKQIPIVVIVALAASLIEAFLALPSHLSDFIRHENHIRKRHESVEHRGWYKKLQEFYTKILTKAIRNRYKVVFGMIAFFIFTVFFAVFVYRIKVILFTGEGIEEFYIRAEAKKGTSLEKVEELLKPVEQLVIDLPKEEKESFRTYIGSISEEHGFDPNAKNGTHLAQVTVFLSPAQHRKRTPQEIIDSLRPKLEKIQGFQKLYFFTPKEGPPTGKPVEIGVKGEDFVILQEIAKKISDSLSKTQGVTDVDINYQFGKKDLHIIIDEAKAQQFYLTVDDIAKTVRYTFHGGVATTVKPQKAEDEIEVLVKFPQQYSSKKDVFDKIVIQNKSGNLVPLKSVAKIEEAEGVYTITHLDGKRTVWITANVEGKDVTAFSVNQAMKNEFKDVPKDYNGYTLKFGGEYEEQSQTQKNLLFSFVVALILIFIILTAILNSLIQPFIIMMSIPFGIIGILLAFMLHGKPLSFFALMGVVGISGVVVNDSIVLVDFINHLRREGKDKITSLIEAGRTRLRPILMTSITTIAGLISVAYNIGGSDPFLTPLGLAMVWGLGFATSLNLIVIPCLYGIVDDLRTRFVKTK